MKEFGIYLFLGMNIYYYRFWCALRIFLDEF